MIMSADISAKKLVNSDQTLINLIKKSFGKNIYNDNILDSKKLSKIVFGNVEKPFRKIGGLIVPNIDEIKKNKRSRSAKMRIAEKI